MYPSQAPLSAEVAALPVLLDCQQCDDRVTLSPSRDAQGEQVADFFATHLGHQSPPTVTPASPFGSHVVPVPCPQCHAVVIPVTSFTFLTAARHALSAVCPGCERRVTLVMAEWLAWGGMPPDDSQQADVATGVLGAALPVSIVELGAAPPETASLVDALASRAEIEQVKGMVMVLLECDSDVAWMTVVKLSQDTGFTVQDLSSTMCESLETRQQLLNTLLARHRADVTVS
jgi:hypothetical protein